MAQLAESLAGYIIHSAKKRKVVIENQRSETPVCSLSENILLSYLTLAGTIPSSLFALSSVFEDKEEYEHVFVNDFAPSQPLRKHRYIGILKKGLLF